MAREAGWYFIRRDQIVVGSSDVRREDWRPARWDDGVWYVDGLLYDEAAIKAEIGERIPSPDERPAHADGDLVEAAEPRCPFCGRDPFHYVNNGVGMEAVAVTCCSLGDAYFRGMRQDPETVTLDWAEFRDIGNRLAAYATRAPERERAAAEAMRAELLNTPELRDFSAGVILEALHQRERWGYSHDAGKEPSDWFWLVGYLAGKALNAAKDGNTEKALHHTISTAAALANWHAVMIGADNGMRPGILPPTAEREEDGHG